MIANYKEKFKKAHEAYKKYCLTNHTNKIEASFLDEATAALAIQHPNSTIITVPDCFLNYLGADFIVADKDKLFLYDLKVCQWLTGNKVLIDGYRKHNGEWTLSVSHKINDHFLFINSDKIIIIPTESVPQPAITDCFFLRRDIYRTTMKAVVDLTGLRKVTISRRTN